MGIVPTLLLMLLGAALAGWANWRERRPYEDGRPPLVPYTLLQFVGIVLFILMAAHMLTLVTGKPFVGRSGI